MSVLLACMCVYHMKAWYLQRSEGSVGSPGSGVTDDCEPLFFNYGLLCFVCLFILFLRQGLSM